jgi:ABC-2 type transport system permease protein
VRKRLRRLREPRYLAGAVVGGAYVYFVFLRRSFRAQRRVQPSAYAPAMLAALQPIATLGLWLVVLTRWFVPVSRQPLEITGAERDLLLCAPVERRHIVRYKLLRSQVAIFLSTAVMLVLGRGAIANPWSFLLGGFLLFATLRVHLLGVALARAALFEGSGRRDPTVWLAVAAAAVATIGALWVIVPSAASAVHAEPWTRAFGVAREQAGRPLVSLALLPLTIMLRPVVAGWPGPFILAAAPVAALAFVNYAWVLRIEGTLQDSIGTAERESSEAVRPAPAPARRRAPFHLAARGGPEWALVWKNLIMLGRYATPFTLLRLAIPVILLAVLTGTSHRSAFASGLYPVTAAVTVGIALLGPYSLRNDLRQDLARLSLLKTWPLSGERLLWGELLAPWLVLTSLAGMLLLVTAGLSLAIPPASLPWSVRAVIGVCALLVLPALILAQIVIQNASVVLFPAWIPTGSARPRGLEAMGQQMLMFAAALLLLAVGLLPGFALAAVIAFLGFGFAGWLALVPAALLLSALLAAECAIAVHFLGHILDRTDPTAVEP